MKRFVIGILAHVDAGKTTMSEAILYETGKLNVTENSYTIHWYDASWRDERMKRRRARNVKIRNTIDGKIGIRLSKIYMTGSYYWEWITTGKWSIIKQKLQSKGKLFK